MTKPLDPKPTGQDLLDAAHKYFEEQGVVPGAELTELQKAGYVGWLSGWLDATRIIQDRTERTGSFAPVNSQPLTIEVPSGLLLVGNDFRKVPHFDVEQRRSINDLRGLIVWAEDFAEKANTGYVFTGNSDPRITRTPDGSVVVVTPEWRDDGETIVLQDEEELVGHVLTDLWAVMVTDYEYWLGNGGSQKILDDRDDYFIISVEPGTYQWITYSHDDDWDGLTEGRIEYARLERVTE